jgi:hypothetical protein
MDLGFGSASRCAADGGETEGSPDETGIVRRAAVGCDVVDPVAALKHALGDVPFAAVILFICPKAAAEHLLQHAMEAFAPSEVLGCTTAGEITGNGYAEGHIVAVGLPQSHFRARSLLVEDLENIDAASLIPTMIRNRNDMGADPVARDWSGEFTFLMIDGLSTREDALTAELAVGLGPVPLFGGSAGDGDNFRQTRILAKGAVHTNAAVLLQVRTSCGVKVFKTDHLVPTDRRMVVTGANPARRTVHELNAEPAAREYARILGKDPEQLTTFTFAAHPVVVKVGGQHHVRAIQRVAENGDLVFFSAIDEGLVLTLAEPMDMVEHLDTELKGLSKHAKPDTILACDCILRRLEAEEKQMTGAISRLLAQHRVVGFSTYGEQLNSMHVNQTLTGVALYPPEEEPH